MVNEVKELRAKAAEAKKPKYTLKDLKAEITALKDEISYLKAETEPQQRHILPKREGSDQQARFYWDGTKVCKISDGN